MVELSNENRFAARRLLPSIRSFTGSFKQKHRTLSGGAPLCVPPAAERVFNVTPRQVLSWSSQGKRSGASSYNRLFLNSTKIGIPGQWESAITFYDAKKGSALSQVL